MELQDIKNQLADALVRIQHLEEQLGGNGHSARWQYLVARPHRWRRQLAIKGRNMTVGQLVSTVRANQMTPEQAADELNLPVAAIQEALLYFDENRALMELEASEERRRLAEPRPQGAGLGKAVLE